MTKPLVSKHVITVYVSHTPWVPARVESYNRLCAQLTEQGVTWKPWTEKAPNHVWSEHMWLDAIGHPGATHALFLQDDVRLAPNFRRALHALIDARPLEVICLESVHQMIIPLAEEGVCGVTTPDGLIGPGYVVPLDVLTEFAGWRTTSLMPGLLEHLKLPATKMFGEDTLLGMFCAVTGRNIFMPVPSLLDHDVSIASTYDNDSHGRRRPLVRWDNLSLLHSDGTPGGLEILENPNYWRQAAPNVGLFYPTTPKTLRAYVPSLSPERYAELKRDDGHALGRKIMYKRRAAGQMPQARILIATPTRGGQGVHPAHLSSILWVARDEEITFDTGAFELYDSRMETYDLVRVRSRAVRYFLEETEATHLFFVDSDVAFLPKVLRGMIRARKDFVAAPYPQREGIDFKLAAAHMRHGNPPEASYGYKVFLPKGKEQFDIDETQCAEIGRVGLGCCLLSRKMLETMVESYTPSLVFDDEVTGSPTVALFQLMFHFRKDGKRALLSEDISFCERVKGCGFKIHAYFGEGSPVDHYGEFCYRGALEAFGCKREG
jgi:hypothetical protein